MHVVYLLPKLTKLKAHCEAISYDVVCIVETWLDSDISDAEVYIISLDTECLYMTETVMVAECLSMLKQFVHKMPLL